MMSRDDVDSDDDLFFGRSRAEELSAVTVRELGRSSSSINSSLGCLSSRAAELQSRRAAELSACRSRDQLTKLPTDTAALLAPLVMTAMKDIREMGSSCQNTTKN